MKIMSSPIQRLFPKRIWQQIFFILVFVIIIPLVILGLLLIRTSQQAIKTTVFRDHKEVAIHATGQVKEHIEGARQSLLVTASILGRLHADPWRQETAIVELSLMNSAFQRISSVGIDGREIVTSELGTERRERLQEEAFQKGLAGESYTSEVNISENHIPFLTIAEPIRRFGKVESVLIADLNVRSVWDIVDNMQFGETGLAYLIDQRGRIIAHPDKKLVLQNTYIPHSNILKDVLLGQAGNTEGSGKEKERLLISYAPIDQLNWGLVISQPESEAYASLKTMKIQSWMIIFLSILAAVLISLVLTRYVSRPINDIMEGTGRLARGDFSHRFRVRQRNEIGRLLFSFNRMTSQLRKARDVEKLSVIGKAATAVAHELKNSLQLVTTFVKLLPERFEDKKFLKEFSTTIPKELDSWNTSLKNMMTFSHNSSPFLTRPINVNAIVQEITSLTKLKAGQLDIDFKESLENDLPAIEGNEEKLKQVLLNLVTNALEATPNGGKISILTKCLKQKGSGKLNEIEIIVTNTCEDIHKIDSDKIFNPFYTTKTGGLGLGLSISKEIVESHDGHICTDIDKNNKAISFLIRIPAYQQSRLDKLTSQL